jgi:membrane protease YdiL (CAAX protease family)
MTQLETAFAKASVPLIATAAVFVAARRRQWSLRDDLGLASPAIRQLVFWLAIYVAFMLGSNAVMGWRGPWDFAPWKAQPLIVSVLRVLAVGVLGPIGEELMFRGFFFSRLARTRLGSEVAIVLVAAAWTAIHVAYAPPILALIFVAGILLGLARWRSGSVIVPIAMHIVWNLYAVW